MPTLPEQIGSLLSDTNIASDLQGQLSMITDAASLLEQLISNPPAEIDDLMAGLSNISVSNIQIPSELTQGFSDLSELIPTDFSSVTSNIDGLLSGFTELADSDIVESIQDYLVCLQGLSELINIDYSKFKLDAGNETITADGATPEGSGGETTTDTGSDDTGGSGDAADTGGDTDPPSSASDNAGSLAVKNVSSFLDGFPTPFNAENVTIFLRDMLKTLPRDNIKIRSVPVYDDLLNLLETLIQFKDMDSTALQAHFENTINQVIASIERDGLAPIVTLANKVTNLGSVIDFDLLKNNSNLLIDNLNSISLELDGGSISGITLQLEAINNSLDVLLPQFDLLLSDVLSDTGNRCILDLDRIDRQMDLSMRRLQKMIQTPASVDFIALIESAIKQGVEDSGISELPIALEDILKKITDVLNLLESSTVKEALTFISAALDAALTEFDTALQTLASEVSALFDNVDNALAQVDSEAFRLEVVSAIADAQQSLEESITDLFSPIRDAVTTAVTTIDTTVSSFDPEQVAAVLRNLIQGLTDILTNPDVVSALDQIRNTLDSVTETIQSVSFSPVVDEVIRGIDEIKNTLNEIDPASINDIIKGALKAALGVLPQDLEQPRTWLTDQLDTLIDEGPKPLIEQIREPVDSLTQQIAGLSPEKLIGNNLSGPFDEFIGQLDQFQPSQLLSPITQGLDQVKGEIADQINLEPIFRPLEDVFNEMLSGFDQFNPAQIIAPIEAQISQVIETVLDALPEEVVFEVLDKIISGIQKATDFVGEIKKLLEKIRNMMSELNDPEAQLKTWLQPVLTLIDSLPDLPDVNLLFTNLNQAVDKLGKDAITTLIATTTEPLKLQLENLQPTVLQNRMSVAYRSIDRTIISELPNSQKKADLLATLDRFNPINAPINTVFSRLELARQCIIDGLDSLTQRLIDWDARFFVDGNPFSALRFTSVDSSTVKTLLKESIEKQTIEPIAKVLSSFTGVFSAFDDSIEVINNFVTEIESTLSEITEGPDSLGEIRDSLAAIVSRFREINLQFLEDELNEVFNAVKQKFEDVNPVVLREALQAGINETLDSININLLLPQTDIDQMDNTYQGLIDKLKLLDPSKLVIDAVKPEFDEKIQPILMSFNLVEPIDALILRLDELGAELNRELSRADQSYRTMLQAVPV